MTPHDVPSELLKRARLGLPFARAYVDYVQWDLTALKEHLEFLPRLYGHPYEPFGYELLQLDLDDKKGKAVYKRFARLDDYKGKPHTVTINIEVQPTTLRLSVVEYLISDHDLLLTLDDQLVGGDEFKQQRPMVRLPITRGI